MKVLVPIVMGLLVVGCVEKELTPQEGESHQQQTNSTEVNKFLVN